MSTLGDLMHDTFVTVAPEDTVGEAARRWSTPAVGPQRCPTSAG